MTLHSPRLTKRGIYFASTLLITVVVTLVITAAIFAVRGNLRASQHLTTGDTALKAAESGIRYAQTKLSANPNWKGDWPAPLGQYLNAFSFSVFPPPGPVSTP